MPAQQTAYVAPARKQIKDEVCKLLPHVPRKLIRKLDWWALFTIHQDVVRDGKDAETLARSLVKGYDPEKIKADQERVAARKAREQERKQRAKETMKRKVEAKRKAAAAKAAARSAKAKARAARFAARGRQAAERQKGAAAVSAAGPLPSAPAAIRGGFGPPPNAFMPPVRSKIKDELARLMPMIKRSDLTGLDYWALYTIYTEIVKFGRDPESLARKFVKGYRKAKK